MRMSHQRTDNVLYIVTYYENMLRFSGFFLENDSSINCTHVHGLVVVNSMGGDYI